MPMRHKAALLKDRRAFIERLESEGCLWLPVAASILTAAYYVVREPVLYKDLGPLYLLRLDHEWAATRLTQRLRDLGYVLAFQCK